MSKKLARQSEENLELKAVNLKQKNMLLEKEAELANYKNQVEILTLALQNATSETAQPASNQSSVRKDLLSSNLASFIQIKDVSKFHPSRSKRPHHDHHNSEQIFTIANDAQKFVTPKMRRGGDEPPPAPIHPRVSEMLIQEDNNIRAQDSSHFDSSVPPSHRFTGGGSTSLVGEMATGRLTLFD